MSCTGDMVVATVRSQQECPGFRLLCLGSLYITEQNVNSPETCSWWS